MLGDGQREKADAVVHAVQDQGRRGNLPEVVEQRLGQPRSGHREGGPARRPQTHQEEPVGKGRRHLPVKEDPPEVAQLLRAVGGRRLEDVLHLGARDAVGEAGAADQARRRGGDQGQPRDAVPAVPGHVPDGDGAAGRVPRERQVAGVQKFDGGPHVVRKPVVTIAGNRPVRPAEPPHVHPDAAAAPAQKLVVLVLEHPVVDRPAVEKQDRALPRRVDVVQIDPDPRLHFHSVFHSVTFPHRLQRFQGRFGMLFASLRRGRNRCGMLHFILFAREKCLRRGPAGPQKNGRAFRPPGKFSFCRRARPCRRSGRRAFRSRPRWSSRPARGPR